jgi:hypothetical protein
MDSLRRSDNAKSASPVAFGDRFKGPRRTASVRERQIGILGGFRTQQLVRAIDAHERDLHGVWAAVAMEEITGWRSEKG